MPRPAATVKAAVAAPPAYQPPQPNPIQRLWLDCPLDDFVFIGTGKGVGKSFGILFKVLRDSQILKDRYHCLITRSSFQSLQEVQGLLFRHLTQLLPGTKYVAAESTFYLGGKAAPFGTVELAYTASSPLEQVRALARLQGRSFSQLIHDETGNAPDSTFYDELMGCLRAAPGTETGMTLLANPGGSGNTWLKARFVDPVAPLEPMRPRRFWSEEYERFVVSVTADCSINPHLDWESYRRSVELMAGGDPAMLDALLRGVWSEIGGAFFQHCWSPKRCRYDGIGPGDLNLRDHTPAPFVAMDWGISSPTVAYLMLPNPPGIDAPKGSLLMLDECYISATSRSGREWNRGANLSNSEQAQVLREWLARWKLTPSDLRILADDAIFSGNGSPTGSVAGDWRQAGIPVRPAEKGRTTLRDGWTMLRNRLRASRHDYTAPWLLWSTRCAGWEATIPSLPRHPRDPETIADGAVDHAADAARYAICWYNGRWPSGNSGFRLW